MKKINLLFLVLSSLLISSCSNEVSESVTYMINEPVFIPAEVFRKSVRVNQEPQTIEKQGKIAFFNGYIYISEPEKGIHIIDNRYPSKPQGIGFIEIMGNVDLAIYNNLLYADSYVDLVWFDISDPSRPVLKGRKIDVFPMALPIADNGYWCDYEKSMDKSKGVVIGWKLVERTEPYNRNFDYYHEGFLGGKMEMNDMSKNSYTSSTNNAIGQTGSMSRFAIYKNYLYTVLNNQLGIFDIESATPEKMGENMYVGNNVETIFSYKNYMYMGTPSGMLIYSVENPVKPELLSTIWHILGCDPVVVENDKAYVTIHSGNLCGQDANQLIIYDVADPRKPMELAAYAMTKPKGLGIDNGTLFVCDDGLKVFNASNPMTIMAPENLYYHNRGMEGYDLIACNKLLMMIADDGIYQYDYTDLRNIKRLSYLAIKNN